MKGNSHKSLKTKYSEQEYLALAKALLGGSFDAANLERPMRELQQYALLPFSLPEDQSEVKSLTQLMNALSTWYIVREDLANGRFPDDSPQVQAAQRLASTIASICAPKMISFIMNGHHQSIRKLADIVEVAKTLPPLADQAGFDKRMQSACKAMGIKPRKPHKSTGRIRLLLPLWAIGFGALPQAKRYEILEKAGLRAEEIPEDDALRQLLTYYKIPRLRKLHRSMKTAQ